jgi:hypothetical protein
MGHCELKVEASELPLALPSEMLEVLGPLLLRLPLTISDPEDPLEPDERLEDDRRLSDERERPRPPFLPALAGDFGFPALAAGAAESECENLHFDPYLQDPFFQS